MDVALRYSSDHMLLDARTASLLARTALGHVTRAYPHKLDHVLEGDEDLRTPRSLHPIFHGSFDWHSCVHGYWLLARVLRLYPEIPEADAAEGLFAAYLTAANVAGECAYLARASAQTFERPYGWSWLLALATELQGTPWASTLRPLADVVVARFFEWLPRATYPIRTGSHGNTAFALALGSDYPNTQLRSAIHDKALRWYGKDVDAQAWEPNGDDFLSATLVEAECMRRLLDAGAFAAWLGRFLPRLSRHEPATLFTPAIVSDRTDGKIVHLDGLNLARAWCWRGVARSLGPLGALATEAADVHLAASLPHVTGDYMGEHWLATFALLALTG